MPSENYNNLINDCLFLGLVHHRIVLVYCIINLQVYKEKITEFIGLTNNIAPVMLLYVPDCPHHCLLYAVL